MRGMLYLDLDNFPHTLPYEKTLEDFHGGEDLKLLARKAFGDLDQLGKLSAEKQKSHILFHCPKLTKTKNSTDIRLSVEVMKDLLTNPSIDAFIIASADTDYVPVMKEVKERGKECILLTQSSDSISDSLAEVADEILVCEKQATKPTRDKASRAKCQEILGKLFHATKDSQLQLASLNSHFITNGYQFKAHGYKSFKQFLTTCVDSHKYDISFETGLLLLKEPQKAHGR